MEELEGSPRSGSQPGGVEKIQSLKHRWDDDNDDDDYTVRRS